ncbi:MAG TPA: hypothetical protein VI730_05770 [Burkholderiales bacterium]|nr:hypothetical protein [Burkholderiales bacterium]
MNTSIAIRTPVALFALALLMAATRFHHFGSATLLPDASLAVFLLGGFHAARARWFVLFLAEAALIDQLAVSWGGASGWCITPAYAFLVPAYGAAWLAGAWATSGFTPDARGAARAIVAFSAGVAGWFAVSNAGFFLFSGYFGGMSALEYGTRVARYLGGYAAAAAAYVLLAAALQGLWLVARRALGRA